MSVKWVHDGKVEVGTLCTTQGEIQSSHNDTLFTRSVRSYQDDWSNNRRAFHFCESDLSVYGLHLIWIGSVDRPIYLRWFVDDERDIFDEKHGPLGGRNWCLYGHSRCHSTCNA